MNSIGNSKIKDLKYFDFMLLSLLMRKKEKTYYNQFKNMKCSFLLLKTMTLKRGKHTITNIGQRFISSIKNEISDEHIFESDDMMKRENLLYYY